MSGLQSKMKYTSDDGFVCLVAEAASAPRAAPGARLPPPAGVVEVSLQGEPAELAALAARGLADDSYAYVACMAVSEGSRRSGAARALLAAAERAAARWRQNWVLLHVHEGNAGAVALYEAAGYTRLAADSDAGGLRALLPKPKALYGKVAGTAPAAAAAGAVMSIRPDLLAALAAAREGGTAGEGSD
jgi:ribosomal protein S18 acetylase RimI-like enzyme